MDGIEGARGCLGLSLGMKDWTDGRACQEERSTSGLMGDQRQKRRVEGKGKRDTGHLTHDQS